MLGRKIFIVLLLTVTAVTLTYGAFVVARDDMRNHIRETLITYGFSPADIERPGFHSNTVIFSNITLDPDGFSTIGAISAHTSLKALLLRQPPARLTIDDVALTGDFTREAGLDIAGWKKTPVPPLDHDEIILNGSQLDLMTGAGALRMQAKGRAFQDDAGVMQLQGALWGVQHQLKFETIWTGHVKPDGGWQYDIQIKNGGLNLDGFKASRVNGWLGLDKTSGPLPALSGQIDAGRLVVGDLRLLNFRITLDGPYTEARIFARAEVAGYQGMTSTLDIQNTATGPQIDAIIETSSLDDLMAFLHTLRTSRVNIGGLTTLLLTEGNIERLRGEVATLTYDGLELQIQGPLYDLIGKVVAKSYKDGVTQRHIVSLDPAG